MLLKLNASSICVALVFSCATVTANAAYLSLENAPGDPTFTTAALGSQKNDVLGAGFTFQDNAVLKTEVDNVRLTFFYVGAESGWDNTIHWGTNFHQEDDSIPGLASPIEKFSGTQDSAGVVDFHFTSINSGWGGGELKPGEGISDDDGGFTRSIGFAFLNADNSVSTTATNRVLVSLDDSGAGPDDNHDDYVAIIEATVVPVPAAAWLFGSALLGLAHLSRRRS